jgi:hypothetical protein
MSAALQFLGGRKGGNVTDELASAMTFGQLSVWRDLQQLPMALRWEGNLSCAWRIPETVAEPDVWRCLGELGLRHESLRTVYRESEVDGPRQVVLVHTAAEIIAAIRQIGRVPARSVETVELRRTFNLGVELPWRAWIDDVGQHVLLVIHHIAADGVGINVMERDFLDLLAGRRLPDGPKPATLAARQRAGADGRPQAAHAYWRRTLESAPRPNHVPARGAVLRATMHTGVAEPVLSAVAHGMGVTLPTVVLAAYCRALCDTATTSSPLLVYAMSSNRFDIAADLVTSMNQWSVLLADVRDGEPLEPTARRLHVASLRALVHSMYDPDVVAQIRAAAEANGAALDPGYFMTMVPPSVSAPVAAAPVPIGPPTLQWHHPTRTTGPAFYLMVETDAVVRLTVRVMREGYGRDDLAVLLSTMRDSLAGLVTAAVA